MCMPCNRIFTISYSFFSSPFSFRFVSLSLSFLSLRSRPSIAHSLRQTFIAFYLGFIVVLCSPVHAHSFAIAYTHASVRSSDAHANCKTQILCRWRSTTDWLDGELEYLAKERHTKRGRGRGRRIKVLHAFDATPRRKTQPNGEYNLWVFFFLLASFVSLSFFLFLLMMQSVHLHTHTHTSRRASPGFVISFLPFAEMHIFMVLSFYSFCATFILCIWQFCIIFFSFFCAATFHSNAIRPDGCASVGIAGRKCNDNNVVGVFCLWQK